VNSPPAFVRAASRTLGRYRYVSRTVAVVILLYSIALVLTGGFEIVIGGLVLRSHEVDKFVALAIVAGLLDVLGDERAVDASWTLGLRVARAGAGLGRFLAGVAGIGLVLGVLFWWVAGFVRPMARETPFADMALLELYTRQATQNDQLLGPYSRFVWHHPGPAMFYLFRPLYEFSGERYESLRWSALVFNIFCLATIFEIVRRRARPLLAWTIATGLAFYLFRFPDLLASPWNPHLLVMPMGLLVVAAAGILDGEPRCWPLVTGVSSFLVQTHLSVGPTVAVVILTTLVWLVVSSPDPALVDRHRRWIGASLWVLGLMWLLPLAEQLASPTGNLTTIYRSFFQKPLAAPPMGQAIAASLNMLSATVVPGLELAFGGLVVKTVSTTGAVVALGSLIAAPWAAARLSSQGDQYGRAVSVLCLTSSLAAIWSVSRIQGEILDQLVFWITILGLFTIACLVAAAVGTIFGWLGSRWTLPWWVTAAGVWIAIAACTATGVRHLYTAHDRWLNEPVAQRVRAASTSLEAYLTHGNLHRPLVRIEQPTWGDAAGIVLALEKAGVSVAVEPRWVFMYGTQLAANGEEDCEVIFADAKRREELAHDSRYVTVAEWPELSIHVAAPTPRSAGGT
jgi:hypothetical protein